MTLKPADAVVFHNGAFLVKGIVDKVAKDTVFVKTQYGTHEKEHTKVVVVSQKTYDRLKLKNAIF